MQRYTYHFHAETFDATSPTRTRPAPFEVTVSAASLQAADAEVARQLRTSVEALKTKARSVTVR